MEAVLLCDRDTYQPVHKSPFAKIERDLNSRLLDLKRQNKIDETTYRKLLSTDGSPPVIRGSIKIINKASLFDRLFDAFAPPSIIHPSFFLILCRRSRTLVIIPFSTAKGLANMEISMMKL